MPYLDKDGLTTLWAKVKNTFALKSHSHTASEVETKADGTYITSGETVDEPLYYLDKAIASGGGSGAVSGVKGNAESSYRTGQVNLTAANIGAAAESHTHAAGDITSGTLSAARGGTGQTTLQATRNAMGLGNTTGALPIARGGTGATTAANARSNLGITCANLGAVGKPRVLFTHDGWTGTKTYLSSAIYNFDIIEVFFITNDGCEGSARGFNGKSGTLYMDLAAMHPTSTSESGIFKFRQVEFSALEMTSSRCCEMAAYSESFKLQESTNAIKIIKVLGWNIS